MGIFTAEDQSSSLPTIFETSDASLEPDAHLNCIGLSECKFVPPAIEFTEQDPLGKSVLDTNYTDVSCNDSDEFSQLKALTKPLGEQANGLKDQRGRMYALERISQAIRINVSKNLVFSILNAIVRTLSFDEISLVLDDLGLDDVKSLIDFMKLHVQAGNLGSHNRNPDCNRDYDCRLGVLSVAIKVFICQNQQALEDVAKFCIEALLNGAKGGCDCLKIL